MSLLHIMVGLAVFGFILYLITTYIPMPEPIRKIIIVVAVVVLILWLLQIFGFLGFLNRPITR